MRWIALAFLLGLLAIPMRADARLTMGTLGGGLSGGSGTGPTCSNSLDFSQACNSQYIAVVL